MNETLKILLISNFVKIDKYIEYDFNTDNKINVNICIVNHDNIELINHNSCHYILYIDNKLNDFQLSKFVRKLDKRVLCSEILHLSDCRIFKIPNDKFIIMNHKHITNINLFKGGSIAMKMFEYINSIIFNENYHKFTGNELKLKF